MHRPADLLSSLPLELKLRVAQSLSAGDISNLRTVNQHFRHLVQANRKFLPRQRRHVEFDLSRNECRVRRESSSQTLTAQCSVEQCGSVLDAVEVSTLSIDGPLRSEAQLGGVVARLQASRQGGVRSLLMRRVRLARAEWCAPLCRWLAAARCLALTLEECELAAGFGAAQADQLTDLCQFTVKNCGSAAGMGLLRRYLSKLAYDMRFRPQRSVPFYAEAPNLGSQELCQFVKTWIHIPEAPHFQIYVTQCQRPFYADFLRECAQHDLVHHHLQFRSKARHSAYIQASFDEELQRFELHPIIDVSPFPHEGFCGKARFFRDF